jgi:hypothetical protein
MHASHLSLNRNCYVYCRANIYLHLLTAVHVNGHLQFLIFLAVWTNKLVS